MAALTTIEIIYWVSTIIGGTLFILRTILLAVGGGVDDGDLTSGDLDPTVDIETDAVFDLDGGVDLDGTIDPDAAAGPDIDGDSDFSFKFISLQGLTAFFMMFGLVGLALFHFGFHVLLTILGGAAAGFFTMWVIGMIFTSTRLLHSEGNLQMRNAIGKVGTVYLTIPRNATGQVQISVQGSLRILNARAANTRRISTGAKVRVLDILDDSLVVEVVGTNQ